MPERPATTAPQLRIRPLTAKLMEDFGAVLRGGWGRGCWCMFPRLTAAQEKVLPGEGNLSQRRSKAMQALARKRRAPGLLAYRDGEAVGWIAVAPRPELARVDASRATPRVDDQPVWVIPCITVRPSARGLGVARALIGAAVDYAGSHGAPAVEAYPRAGDRRTKDDNAFYGTQALFAAAGFTVVRGPLPNLPRNWPPRVTMRRTCGA